MDGMELVDTHAHLEDFEDIESVMAAARAAGLAAVVAVGMDISSSARALEIAARFPGFVYPAVGWYPANVDPAAVDDHLRWLDTNLPNAAAVGEVGLDYMSRIKNKVPKELQREVLVEVLRLARAHGKPALLHTRYAWQDALRIATGVGLEKAVFHSFTGPSSVLRGLLETGYSVSVTPAVAYNAEMQRVVRETPLDRLLLETDCPVVFAEHRTGDEPPATPAGVVKTLRAVASLTGISADEIAAATTANAKSLLGIG